MYRLLAGFITFLVKLLLSLLFYGTPLIGFWVASSLAAYFGGPSWMAWAAGALLFPIIPGIWELRAMANRSPESKTKAILTPLDRLSLRTFAVGLVFLAVLLYFYPQKAFVSLSTRGDWMLDGVKDPRADKARRYLFKAAGGLEWLYDATKKNQYEDLIDKSAIQTAEKAAEDREKETIAQQDGLFFKPEPLAQDSSDTSKEGDSEQKPSVAQKAKPTWPWKQSTLHPVVASMPSSVETSIASVAKYIAEKESDPVLRIKALHDYVADRIAYDADALYSGNIPSQNAQRVFKTHKSVCAGYANLLAAMASAINEKIVVVVGDARDPSTGDRLTGVGHAWNAACIEGNWYLIDSCWDSGYVSREKGFTKSYGTEYLCPPPEVMIEDHFPDKQTWQLLSHPLSQGEFLRQPMLRPSFQANHLTLVTPQRARTEADSKAVVVVKNPGKVWIMTSLEQNGKEVGKSSASTNRQTAQLERPLPGKGTYRLNMFVNEKHQYGQYDFVGCVDFVNR